MGRSVELEVAMTALAKSLLAPVLPRRWCHVGRSHAQARSLAGLEELDADLLAAAAIGHDIGYSPSLVETGFHAIDGARFLRREGVDERIVSLVAHHSCAAVEADLRGLSKEIGDFAPGPAHLTDALIYCDMTSGPDGQLMTPEERIAEILVRHAGNEYIEGFIARARGELLAASRRVARTLVRPVAAVPAADVQRQAGVSSE